MGSVRPCLEYGVRCPYLDAARGLMQARCYALHGGVLVASIDTCPRLDVAREAWRRQQKKPLLEQGQKER